MTDNTAPADFTSSVANKPPAHIDEHLDCRGLRCPWPLLKTKQALHRLAAGAVLEVMAGDVGAVLDIPAYLQQSPHRLLGQRQEADAFIFWIVRGD